MSSFRTISTSRLSTRSQSTSPASPISEYAPSSPSSDPATTNLLVAVKDLKKRVSEDMNRSILSAGFDLVEHPSAIDDRKLAFEHVLTCIANHPKGKIQDFAQNFVVKRLYDDLAHPPETYLDPASAFRTPDGSNNNLDFPNLGKAGTPYARSVQQSHPLPINQLPDAGLVFDTLLCRDEFRKHPGGLSSLMFSFATLVIHMIFRTDIERPYINTTSSYADLAPLYGNDQATQDKIRIKDGRGLLYPDTFTEDRFRFLPPASTVILILFNRNHNYIARRLLEINERGNWVDPSKLTPNDPKLLKQEDEIFQIARLCNCGWFASIALSDYFSTVLGLVRKGSSWCLEPFNEFRTNHQWFERGRGNACSVEFNCLYRWHATLSREDEDWIKDEFGQLFHGKDPEKINMEDFYHAALKLDEGQDDVFHLKVGDLNRQPDGTFKDSDLANILKDATSHQAAAFGARGTPRVMRISEILGIKLNRDRGVCSFNDFRQYLGLKRYSSFEEWNPDKRVASAAEKLYGHIDNLELYVGLQAEETMPVVDGSGFCPGYTISRAILSDATALTRGDRFFNQDFTPHNMTAWGYTDCQRDSNGWGFGSTFGRLLLRTLPNDYDEKSVYTWFSFMHPQEMEKNLKDIGKLGDYSLDRPQPRVSPIPVSGYVEVGEVLRNCQTFTAMAEHRAHEVIKGKGFFCASSDTGQVQNDFVSALAPSPDAVEKIGQYFYKKTAELISAASCPLINSNTRSVNLVADVLNLVPIYWAASEIAGIPLKDERHHSGVYTPRELYSILGEIYQFIFLEVEPAKYMVMKQRVQGHVEELSHHIKNSLINPGARLSIANIFGSIGSILRRKKSSHSELLQRLSDLGHSHEQVINEILALLVGMTVEVSLALTNVVNYFLPDSKAKEDTTFPVNIKDAVGLEAYVIEALRIDPPFAGASFIAKKDHSVGSLVVKKGEHVFLNVASAAMNEDAFPNPTMFDASRTPRARYLRPEVSFKVVGADIPPKLIVQVLRSVLSLDNLRRAPGQSGRLQRFQDSSLKDLRYVYLDANQLRSPWPTSLIVLYDGPPSPVV